MRRATLVVHSPLVYEENGTRPLPVCIAVISLLTLGLGAQPSFGAGICGAESLSARYHIGAATSSSETYGVAATIERRVPQLCSGKKTFSAAWVMLSGGAGGYAQAGFGNSNGRSWTGYKTFSEWSDCASGCPLRVKIFDGPSQDYQYKVVFNFVKRKIEMFRGTLYLGETTYDPFFQWTWPWSNQMGNETTHCATDTIGTRDNAAHFTGIAKRNADKTWSSIADLALRGPTGGCGRYYKKWGNAPRLFYIWTYPL